MALGDVASAEAVSIMRNGMERGTVPPLFELEIVTCCTHPGAQLHRAGSVAALKEVSARGWIGLDQNTYAQRQEETK